MLQLYNTFAQEMAKLLLDWLKNQIFLSQEMQYFYTTVTSNRCRTTKWWNMVRAEKCHLHSMFWQFRSFASELEESLNSPWNINFVASSKYFEKLSNNIE